MENLFYIVFIPVFFVWVMYQRLGKGGLMDEVLSAGLLEINRRKEENQD